MLFENNSYIDDFVNMNYSFNSDDILKRKFNRGNMFDDEYVGYKDYKVLDFTASSEKEKMLLEIMQISFAINDYNLYLDLFPEDRKVYLLFKEYSKLLLEKKDAFEKKYGPLCVDNTNYDKYMWNMAPWPWEGDIKYV